MKDRFRSLACLGMRYCVLKLFCKQFDRNRYFRNDVQIGSAFDSINYHYQRRLIEDSESCELLYAIKFQSQSLWYWSEENEDTSYVERLAARAIHE